MKQYTLYYTPETWFSYDEGNTLWGHDDAKLVELADDMSLEWIHGESKEIRSRTAKIISKLLNT